MRKQSVWAWQCSAGMLLSAAGVHSFVPAEAETGGQYTRCTSLLTSCMYGNCFHGLIIAASPCIFCRNGAHFLLYPSVIFDKLSGDAQSCSFMWYRRIKKGAAGSHCHLLLQVLYKRPHPQNGGAFYYYTIIMFIWNYCNCSAGQRIYCSDRKKVIQEW